MFLRRTTDYAFRILLYLSGCQRPRSLEEISHDAMVPATEALKVLRRLKSEGFIDRLNGEPGGYVLARAPEKIRMLQIMHLFEGTLSISRCLEEDGECDRDGPKKGCPVRAYLQEVQKMMETKLNAMTFQELQRELESADEGEIVT